MLKVKYYWDIVAVPYQMGPHKHRIYMLDLLKKEGVRSILDVGCGTGPIYDLIKNTWEETADGITSFKRWEFEYKGVDYSEHFIECAKRELGDMFEVQDARHLEEKDNSYDCVILMHALDHVKQYEEVIAETARVSSKYVCIILWRMFVPTGGQVQVNDRNMMDKKEGEEPWEDTYLMQFTKEALEDVFMKNNLEIVETAEGEQLNSGQSQWNFLYLLKKI